MLAYVHSYLFFLIYLSYFNLGEAQKSSIFSAPSPLLRPWIEHWGHGIFNQFDMGIGVCSYYYPHWDVERGGTSLYLRNTNLSRIYDLGGSWDLIAWFDTVIGIQFFLDDIMIFYHDS